jgi:hypothetical protein
LKVITGDPLDGFAARVWNRVYRSGWRRETGLVLMRVLVGWIQKFGTTKMGM